MKKGLLIILSGPSGVGKGTVRKYLMEQDHFPLSYSISMTTRLPRNGEVDGVDYYFVSKEEFQNRIDHNEFLEWAEFVGNRYGTPKDKVEALRKEGKDVLLEIETNGARQVLATAKDDRTISIFLVPPDIKALEERIRGRRSESEEVIQLRLEKGKSEMELAKLYDYVVVNNDVRQASREIDDIIRKNQ